MILAFYMYDVTFKILPLTASTTNSPVLRTFITGDFAYLYAT
jgi:hypothetical protein